MADEPKKEDTEPWGSWCAFRAIECERTACALRDPKNGLCIFREINNNLYHIRKHLKRLDESIQV